MVSSSCSLVHVGKKPAKARHPGPATEGTRPCSLSRPLFPPLPESSEVEDFELKFTGGVPGPTSQDLLCEIRDSPSPVVLHIEATFKVLLGAWAAAWARHGAGVGPRAHSQVAH